MGQRRKVAAGADRTLLRDDRQEVGVEVGEESLHHQGPDARMTPRQDVRAQQHQRAGRLRRQRAPHPRAVTADQVELQLLEPIARDADVLEEAEPGGHAVNRLVGGDDPVDDRAGALEPGARRRAQGDARAAPRDGRDLLQTEVFSVELDYGGHPGVAPCAFHSGNWRNGSKSSTATGGSQFRRRACNRSG